MPLVEKRCPVCYSPRLWESSSGWLRWPARLVFLYPLRCDSCRHRFWRFAWNPPPTAGRPRPADAATGRTPREG